MNSELLVANGMSRVDDYLAHYGRSVRDGAPVGSGRYHLGSGADPYQMFTRDREDAPRGLASVVSKLKRHGGGTATPEEKKLLKQQLKIQKAEFKTKKAEEKKAAKEEAEHKKAEDLKRQIEEKKFKLLREGNVDEILKNQQLFTTQELQSALERNSKLKALQSELPKEKTLVDKVDRLFGTVNKAAGWIETGAKFAKAVQNMKAIQDAKNNPQTSSLGQRYAAEFLASIKGKKLNEIDAGDLKAQMGKISSINDLYNMATKGTFGKNQETIKGAKPSDNDQKSYKPEVSKPSDNPENKQEKPNIQKNQNDKPQNSKPQNESPKNNPQPQNESPKKSAEQARYERAEERREADVNRLVSRALENLTREKGSNYGSPAYLANQAYQLANGIYGSNQGNLTPTEAAYLEYMRNRYGI